MPLIWSWMNRDTLRTKLLGIQSNLDQVGVVSAPAVSDGGIARGRAVVERRTADIIGDRRVLRGGGVVEINAADTLELDKIKGVGPAFARRIVKYRERLGGFHSKEQLFEVYGVDTLKYNEIKDQIRINEEGIKKININTADFEALKNHPYLKYKQINAIIQYRKQHGMYSGIADLKKVLILSPQTIEQLTPYLQF